jgi:hypothetical protein
MYYCLENKTLKDVLWRTVLKKQLFYLKLLMKRGQVVCSTFLVRLTNEISFHWSKLTLIELNQGSNYVRLMLISTFYVLKKYLKNEKRTKKMTYSSIVEQNQMNCWNKNCRTSQQSPLSSIVKYIICLKIHC